MKIFCKTHGVHFPDEFDKSLKCSFWKEHGLKKLPKKYKKMIWDTQFSIDVDKIALETKISINIQIFGTEIKGSVNQFEENIEEYKSWDDDKRKNYQKMYFYILSILTEEQKQKLLMEKVDEIIRKDIKLFNEK